MNYCSKCDKYIEDDSLCFCETCGNPLIRLKKNAIIPGSVANKNCHTRVAEKENPNVFISNQNMQPVLSVDALKAEKLVEKPLNKTVSQERYNEPENTKARGISEEKVELKRQINNDKKSEKQIVAEYNTDITRDNHEVSATSVERAEQKRTNHGNIIVFIIIVLFLGVMYNFVKIPSEVPVQDINHFILIKNQIDQEITVLANDINSYTELHSDFSGANILIERGKTIAGKIKTTKQKLNQANIKDPALKNQLLIVLDTEARRINGMVYGMLASKEGRDYLPEFKKGTVAAYQFDRENAKLIQLQGDSATRIK